jgi:hypothetical protein
LQSANPSIFKTSSNERLRMKTSIAYYCLGSHSHDEKSETAPPQESDACQAKQADVTQFKYITIGTYFWSSREWKDGAAAATAAAAQ